MLQQTQTSRVVQKYEKFIQTLPTIDLLAQASNEDILRLWQGLGYNRRGLYLKKSAEIIISSKHFPNTIEELVKLPGIGRNTAGAIMAFAFDTPVIFIETNIRRVFIHEFFSRKTPIDDKEILPIIKTTLPEGNIRNWYYALMDYGSYLGRTEINPNRKSKQHKRQSKFEGSVRQTRGAILKELLKGHQERNVLADRMENPPNFSTALTQLIDEGFIEKNKDILSIKS